MVLLKSEGISVDLDGTHKGSQVDISKQGGFINGVHGIIGFVRTRQCVFCLYIPNVRDRAGHAGGTY